MKFILGVLTVLFSYKANSQVNSGVVVLHSYVVNKTMPDSILGEGPLYARVYFLDSTVIYEVRILRLRENEQGTGKNQENSRPISKYTFLDLRTMLAQDYLDFHDTAKPKLSYPLLKDEYVKWRFYAKNLSNELGDRLQELSDTVIGNQQLKRVLLTIQENGMAGHYICYIDCEFPKSIFHFNKSLEKKYGECVVNRMDFPLDSISGNVYMANEFYFERKHLNSFEEKVFRAWKENSTDKKLRLSTYKESFMFGRDIP